MALPGFSAEIPLRRASALSGSTPFVAARATVGANEVTPQQQADICHSVTGPCTHSWPFFAGTQCATGASGFQHCCGGAFQFPWIRECQNPDGSWRTEGSGCGFCV